jgi:hypothetical protein
MDEFHRASRRHLGPGGTKCNCCNFYHPETLLRRLQRRILKREGFDSENHLASEDLPPFWDLVPDPLVEEAKEQAAREWAEEGEDGLYR